MPLMKVSFRYQDYLLVLDPLRGEIDAETSSWSCGKVKVEIRLFKRELGRWGGLVGQPPVTRLSLMHDPTILSH